MWQFLNRHRVLDQSKSSVRLYETAARYVLPAMVFLVGLRKNFDLCCVFHAKLDSDSTRTWTVIP